MFFHTSFYSVVKCGAMWWSVEQCSVWSVMQCGEVWWSVVKCGEVWWSVEQFGGVWSRLVEQPSLGSSSLPTTRPLSLPLNLNTLFNAEAAGN